MAGHNFGLRTPSAPLPQPWLDMPFAPLQVSNIFEMRSLEAMARSGASSLVQLKARVKGVAASKWDNYGAAVLQVGM